MTEPAPVFPHYSIEVDFPDLGAHRAGNLGVDYVHRFDPARPDAARFADQDFNRVWMPAVLDDLSKRSVELDRARAIRPFVDEADWLLDLHSMHERSAPLIVTGPLDKGTALALQIGAPATVIRDEGHPEGKRMRDYGGFGDPASAKNALLFECGQHWEARAVAVARDSTARFLAASGAVDEQDLPDDWFLPLSKTMRIVQVTEPVVAASDDFRFAGAYTGLEHFAEAGATIGWSNGKPVTTPYPDCVLVMPSLRQLRPGVTVVRLGRLEREVPQRG
ncbi:succinylglutamate desuccinylase / Aspartoacylase family protein [Burkholderia thailandensis 34]|uniref:succinylglutamate desuccinylase/aspartoacylase family protein n=1 Tax=Burkholderia thailandensis TaxID=57975 RepID=UPI0005D86B73|nr:succinylglutamate desuccinylase/aspartoacylase family protein [Burkholderia thailandensis]AJY31746.1 succinylglutamate desuccinylase / Aspartoacylase family protein [Burkholderia thailandensis 34]AOJ58638.1 succinylglutamate desuccinylase [Burkholderia thailandensis]KXF57757.1 succinylglutamate desuccinylase [Burkholderia thailandensis]PNE77500.1 succinylglutamate desuccinylase [Burkholderia thailandensis]